MELYLSDHPTDCAGCARGNCEIQALATTRRRRRGALRPAGGRARTSPRRADTSNPYFDYDPAACIVCSRCVRACDEIQGTFALTVEGRGFDSRITAGGTDFLSSECVSCGACVQACPTDALPGEVGRRARHADPQRSTRPAPTAASAARSAPRCPGDGDDTRVVRMIP